MKIEWGKLKLELNLDFDDLLVGLFWFAGLCCLFSFIAAISCGIYTELNPERYRPSAIHTESTVITNGK